MPDRRSLTKMQRQPSAWTVLGLRDDDTDHTSIALTGLLDNLARIWPLAVAAQAIACVALLVIIAATRTPVDAAAAAIASAGTLLLSTGLWGALKYSGNGRLLPHTRNRIVTIVAAPLGACQLGLLWEGAMLSNQAMQSIAVVSAAGALGLTMFIIHQIRAAPLSLAIGITVILAILSSAWIAVGVAAMLVGCAAVATVHLARLDHAHAIQRAEQAREGSLAAKMIAEFETHGTGWFWESDRQGRLTYLSEKVAAELAEQGPPPVGALLTDVFRMDSATPGTERTLGFHISSRTSFSDYSVCSAYDLEASRWWSISGRPLIDEFGRFQGFIGSGSDLTSMRQSEAEITRLALFDSLTGLANRQRMRLSLEKTLTQHAGSFRPSSLFLMDLDRFKAINDTLGHQAGDMLLKLVAQRLERGVGSAGLVGRLGGDEFQVLLPGIDHAGTLSALAKDLIASLSQPYFISDTSVTIGCSIGVAVAPRDGEDAETLTRNADLALYAAKADGRGVHRFFSENMLEGARNRKRMEDDLRAAITSGGFHIAYQPVVCSNDERIVGYEALLRWEHPTLGMISPTEFIPVAEECGMIEAVGEWALRTACREAACWPHRVRVAVNVSPIQFANPNFPALVASALANSRLPADQLELEITEGVFLDKSRSTDEMFRSLKSLGVRLSLDDFGTGYSSLGYLSTAPFDKIKIDQSFVKGAARPGNRNAALIKAIVTLADTLGMETTAEGVEIQDEIELIRSLGCSHIQGFVYGEPADAEGVRRQLAETPKIKPMGHKISRAPRHKMLRSARFAIGKANGNVRIRNISITGAMIDGVYLDPRAIGTEVLIELVENEMTEARIAWASEGRAGIAFAENIDLDHVSQALANRHNRRSA